MTRLARWLVFVAAALVILVWPPEQDRSLAMKTVNWIADPFNDLPTLPGPLAPGLGDDADAVVAHDLQMSEYDRLYASSKMMRTRLELKVAKDPFNPSTERQLLVALGVLTALGAWMFGRKEERSEDRSLR